MVRFLALRIRERLPQQVEMEDLISAGIVGLMDAMQKFDSKKEGAVPHLCAVSRAWCHVGQPARAGLGAARFAQESSRSRRSDSVSERNPRQSSDRE